MLRRAVKGLVLSFEVSKTTFWFGEDLFGRWEECA